MNRYVYEGPVYEFGRCVSDRWKGETVAYSKAKAINNLKFQFKKQTNKLPAANISISNTAVKKID